MPEGDVQAPNKVLFGRTDFGKHTHTSRAGWSGECKDVLSPHQPPTFALLQTWCDGSLSRSLLFAKTVGAKPSEIKSSLSALVFVVALDGFFVCRLRGNGAGGVSILIFLFFFNNFLDLPRTVKKAFASCFVLNILYMIVFGWSQFGERIVGVKAAKKFWKQAS